MAEIQRTMFAAQAVGLADYFKFLIGKKHELSSGHIPELSAPDGESTEGGKLALQHIKLVPPPGGATVVIGHVNSADKRAEINSFARTQGSHKARFGGVEVPFAQAEYDALVDAMHGLFSERGLRVVMMDDRPAAAPAVAAVRTPKPTTALVVAAATAAFAVLLVAIALLR